MISQLTVFLENEKGRLAVTSVSTMVVSGAATLLGTPQPSTTGTMNGEIDAFLHIE